MTDTLPIEIQRTILDGLEPIAQSFVYAIANSTALGSEGQVIPYAVDLTKDSNAWFFNVLKETQEGRESIEECVNTHYDELLKLLSGIHQDYWDYDDETDRSFLQEHWRDCAGDYLEYTSLEDYHKDNNLIVITKK